MEAEEVITAAAVFGCLTMASLGTLFLYDKLPERYRRDDTASVVRLIANIFVVMTSLAVGLMINSSRNTFETADRNVHLIAIEMILLDRVLRHYGLEAKETRERLQIYARRTLEPILREADPLVVGDKVAESLLLDIGKSLGALKPFNADQMSILQDARSHFQKMVSTRWHLVQYADGTIPRPMIILVAAWLVLIFGSFGYKAPKNIVIVGSFILAAALMAGSIYLIMDMDAPMDGLIKISLAPMERVIAELQ